LGPRFQCGHTHRRWLASQDADCRGDEYSNLGFDSAALVAERISGQRIESGSRERYLTPLAIPSRFARPPRFANWPDPPEDRNSNELFSPNSPRARLLTTH